ncbi:hypothetical protein [Pseudomonas capsici]|uniref:Lipoprotein n=1 Tax=Pseudomonas capsici TaxID=2810614 RepID=A0ABT3C3J6_9PSED|nr:hypothetical protein [Pseudomonas capsici]MBN6715488.1 hypothetical protein [Pseudomonas capsici]MBN6720397.1 hypothetical protein [Pseudomonas capsici]MBN6725393.1 hypothetical protein [Pseudomonas capsici]MCV4270727.1 hypothetical protein [Pseudomonas capsici]MCV4280921.1 hypothetical protein [Pseudomonas capsici]
MKVNGLLIITLAVSTAILGACASIPELMARKDWEGRDINDAFEKWGPPQKMEQTPNGVFAFTWTMAHDVTESVHQGTSQNYSNGVLYLTDHYADETRRVGCKIVMYAAPDQKILKAYSQGGCNGYMTSPVK